MTNNQVKTFTDMLHVHMNIGNIIRGCHPWMMRWQDEKQYEEPAIYRKAVRQCCRENGFQFVRVNNDFTRINLIMKYEDRLRKVIINLAPQRASYDIEE